MKKKTINITYFKNIFSFSLDCKKFRFECTGGIVDSYNEFKRRFGNLHCGHSIEVMNFPLSVGCTRFGEVQELESIFEF